MGTSKGFFLERLDTTEPKLHRVVEELVGMADYADIYFESTRTEFVSLEQGKIKEVSGGITQGAGVRVLAGEKTGYAVTNDISIKQLGEAASAAAFIAERTSGSSQLMPTSAKRRGKTHNLYALSSQPMDVSIAEKAKLLSEIDVICRSYDERIQEVIASIVIADKKVLVCTNDGFFVDDLRPLLVLRVQCIAAEGARREMGNVGGGGRVEYRYLLEQNRFHAYAREAARRAVENLSAVEAPAGSMIVVLGPGWPGVLLHEAIGHGLEGDFNRKELSAFAGRMGKIVASELCTVVDDGTMPNRRGSLNVDDEGTPTQRNILIEQGRLVGYIQDKLNARIMGMKPTGNGRRESFAHHPMPRMTNTFMLSGEASPEDIIKSVKFGVYAVYFGGGQVDITNGNFVFNMTEAYLIEDGEVTKPLKGATLIGNGPTALTKVSMVGDNLTLDEGIGTCGKNGQSVPVGVGIPTIKIDEMTVGGSNTQVKGGSMI